MPGGGTSRTKQWGKGKKKRKPNPNLALLGVASFLLQLTHFDGLGAETPQRDIEDVLPLRLLRVVSQPGGDGVPRQDEGGGHACRSHDGGHQSVDLVEG